MTGTAPQSPHGRFPGFDVLAQSGHWDPVTSGVVLSRLGMAPGIRFFSPAEQAVATALCDQLLDQQGQAKVPVVSMIDMRLAEKQTDGWHYKDMPEDGQAWRGTLAALDSDAQDRYGTGFAACTHEQQRTLIQAVQDLGADAWHGLPRPRPHRIDVLRRHTRPHRRSHPPRSLQARHRPHAAHGRRRAVPCPLGGPGLGRRSRPRPPQWHAPDQTGQLRQTRDRVSVRAN